MSVFLPAAFGLVVIAIIFMMAQGRAKRKKAGKDAEIPGESEGPDRKKKTRGRDAIIRDAVRRLNVNPHDIRALKSLGDIYFGEEAWMDALKSYQTLAELAPSNNEVDGFEANLRRGLSALRLNMADEAHKGFSAAWVLRENNFEVNYNLGYLEFQKKNYEKASQFLQKARQQNPESALALRYLGHALFALKKFPEAQTFIRKAIDIAPDDRESLYTLGECHYEAGQGDQALRIFRQLRADPVMGPAACLLSGAIYLDQHNTENAVHEFEIGLRHQGIKPDTLLDLRYRLALAYIKQNNIGKAMALLALIRDTTPGYKDVAMLIDKYRELNVNRNLQIYLLAPSAEFAALCRKILSGYYPRSKVNIIKSEIHNNEWADIVAEVDTSKWSDTIMFRFIRSQGSIGELALRDLLSRLKEEKAGKGVCITVGSFSDEARRYSEARLIDLVGREGLSAQLNMIDTSGPEFLG
ncbi:hypothetical protein FACS189485_09670 [Spirochaetia bacterium]|nr:hypothetical protein FACS189485_09670 [Spirochaetia bacterium]